MKKITVILLLLLLGCVLVSCMKQNASAMDLPIDLIEIPEEDEPAETAKEPLVQSTVPKTPKLSTLDGLTVDENGEFFSWNPGAHVKSYQVRIAGIDRIRRTLVDYNYKVKSDTPYFSLPQLNEGEYFLLVKAKSKNLDYLNSDWAVMEYRIGVEAPTGDFVDCHNNWSGFYIIFESTEDTEGLEARVCETCLKSQVLRRPALPSAKEWMVYKLINGDTEYSVGAHYSYTELPYEEANIPAYHNGKPVTQIRPSGFDRMLQLKTVVIPDTVSKIGDGAFQRCTNLTNFIFEGNNACYKFDSGCLIEIETNKIIAGTKNSVIPNYITAIGAGAFYDQKLENIFIHASVNEVGINVFAGCDKLESAIFEAESQLERISFNMFGGCTSLKNIVLPQNLKSIDESAFEMCTNIKSIIIPRTCTYIGNYAFAGWKSSQTIIITAFSSLSAANEAFVAEWAIYDRNDPQPRVNLVFLG